MEDQIFISAVDLDKHPIRDTKQALKTKYYYVLQYYVETCTKSAYAESRLMLYRDFLLQNNTEVLDYKKCEKAIVTCRFRPWRKKYRYWLVCDLMLILCDFTFCQQAVEMIKAVVTKKQVGLINDLIQYLENGEDVYKRDVFESCDDLIHQFWDNRNFRKLSEKRIVVTANMSAGKSTLINAIIGDDLARTSQEVCTGNLCRFYNLPFSDGTVHFKGKTLSFSSSADKYKNFEWDSEVALATCFFAACSEMRRICLIDTPGVNSALRREHGQISKKFISEGKYDQILYILNGNKLGTDEEIAYLKWIYKNVPAEKLIFVLNKLDDFKRSEDSISSSINGVKVDLEKIGFNNPVIYPISAYFACLLKKEAQEKEMSDDELDELNLFKKKFLKPDYNLSSFYDSAECGKDFEGYIRRSGLLYLENILYGGLL